MTRISIYECKICGKRFRSINEIIDHAVKDGHFDFREILLNISLDAFPELVGVPAIKGGEEK